ncbi:hypothetical protein MMC18_002593 [Xylographa bjoerkii]|nr:hypothetical protein [Xylographa bjoerkii]
MSSPMNEYHIPDPPLSELGVSQCAALQNHLQQNLELAQRIELIVVSPMRRTLQTAQIALRWLITRGVPVLPSADWQENSDSPCDTGSTIDVLAKEYPTIDFKTLAPEYPAKNGRWEFSQEAVLQRGADCRRWLLSRPEKVIAIVSHSAFLRLAVCHSRFENADYRVFDFKGGHDDELVEWKMSENAGGGMGRSQKGHSFAESRDFRTSLHQKKVNKKETPEEVVDEIPKK